MQASADACSPEQIACIEARARFNNVCLYQIAKVIQRVLHIYSYSSIASIVLAAVDI